MPSKTSDLEYAISTALVDGPLTLDALQAQIPYAGDPRWIAVALMHLRQDAVIHFTACDGRDHGHDGGCVVELA